MFNKTKLRLQPNYGLTKRKRVFQLANIQQRTINNIAESVESREGVCARGEGVGRG